MKINSLQLNNFKCFDDRTFAFGPRVQISGKNGSGKSSIREAILFVLYNRTETAVKETDKYIKNDEDFCEVTLNTDQGTIKRQRNKSKSKLWLDNSETTQENLVDKLKLPEFVVFNSVFTAGYFMSLDEKAQRQIILDLTEPVDRDTIFKKNGGTQKDLDDFGINLEDLDEAYKRVNALKQSSSARIEVKKSENLYFVDSLKGKCAVCGADIKDKKKIEKKIEECKEDIIESEEKQVRAKNMLDMIKKIPRDEIEIKMIALEADIKKIVPGAEIKLMELLKSAIGYKPVFKLLVNGKEYRFLSTGEKKRVDVGLCEFLNNFYKLDMMFIDNMESITGELPVNFKQVFTSRVLDDELRVVIK
jgi:DNA repair exonuclease SbcCD ATPase subunit